MGKMKDKYQDLLEEAYESGLTDARLGLPKTNMSRRWYSEDFIENYEAGYEMGLMDAND